MRLFFKILFFILLIIVTFLSLTPSQIEGEQGIELTRFLAKFFLGNEAYSDKIGHFLAYGALGFSVSAAMFFPLKKLWVPMLGLSFYGFLLEFIQFLGGTRYGEFLDALSNMLGIVAGITGFLLLAFVTKKMLR